MRRKTPRFSKLALSIFVAIFALSFISLSGSNGLLKPSIAEAADPAVGLTRDNPGIRMAIEVQGRHSEVCADWAGSQRGTPMGGLHLPIPHHPAVYGPGCVDAICCKR